MCSVLLTLYRQGLFKWIHVDARFNSVVHIGHIASVRLTLIYFSPCPFWKPEIWFGVWNNVIDGKCQIPDYYPNMLIVNWQSLLHNAVPSLAKLSAGDAFIKARVCLQWYTLYFLKVVCKDRFASISVVAPWCRGCGRMMVLDSFSLFTINYESSLITRPLSHYSGQPA